MAKKQLNVSDGWVSLSQNNTWIDILAETARRLPDNEALVFENKRITYREYLRSVDEFAKGLSALGVVPGDHVAVWMTNRPEWCYTRHAIYKIGARMIPVSTRYRTEDLDYLIGQSDARWIIMESTFLCKINSMEMLRKLCPELEDTKPEKMNCRLRRRHSFIL